MAAVAMVVIHVGTGCSGMGAVFFALRALGVPFRHLFGSEVDKAARSTLWCHAPPDEFKEDIYQQNTAHLPTTDLYVAGFPCQSFSQAGLQGGFETSGGLVI